jgi:integrase-like protein
MKYSTSVRKRRRRARLEWMARLIYRDPTTGKRRERSRSARTRREAIMLEMALRYEFMAEIAEIEDSGDISVAQLAKYFQKREGCKALYDAEGRKLREVKNSDAYDAQFLRFNEFFGRMKIKDIRFWHLEVYRNERYRSGIVGSVVVKTATVNREMCTLRAMLNVALAKNWISENPFDLMRKGELIMSGYLVPPEERLETDEPLRNK